MLDGNFLTYYTREKKTLYKTRVVTGKKGWWMPDDLTAGGVMVSTWSST